MKIFINVIFTLVVFFLFSIQAKETPVVTGTLLASKGDDFKMDLKIKKGWYIYGPVQDAKYLIPSKITVPEKAEYKIKETKYPEPIKKELLGIESQIFKDSLSVKVSLEGAPKGTLVSLNFGYQTCNGKMCLPPTTLKLTAK